ncbi:MAG: N-acetylglucosamine-6-phosphate deacetylase [Marivita sp.]|uniref:N-acetylglucosamine-6-phosphate deacetylase n=1 Tax=Marivita sp. TaxID=2003365 RepID=UPI003EF9F641
MDARTKAYIGAQIHDGIAVYRDHAIVASATKGVRILPEAALPAGCQVECLDGGMILPGFVDLQVNGGGGVMFNDAPSVTTLRVMAKAHAALGTTAFLPTLITDTPEATRAAIDAVEAAVADGVDGIVGLHLEGPHLSVVRKGAHDAHLIRPMTDADLALLLDAARRVPNLMVTIAPETTRLDQISAMAEAGILVSLGHTDADYATCTAAFDAGARCVTHLFNAMSQLGNREPGLVGATLDRADVYAGLIADGIHVHPASIRAALAAKPNADRVFLVTDAMATAGTDSDHFLLNGRDVFRQDNRLTLVGGTLAGAHLSLSCAISNMVNVVGDSAAQAIARATSTPASLLRGCDAGGRIHATTRSANYLSDITSADRVIRRLSFVNDLASETGVA